MLSLISQNCLHPDQDRQDVGPDWGSNCLPRLLSREQEYRVRRYHGCYMVTHQQQGSYHMSLCIVYNVVLEKHSVQNPHWLGRGWDLLAPHCLEAML